MAKIRHGDDKNTPIRDNKIHLMKILFGFIAHSSGYKYKLLRILEDESRRTRGKLDDKKRSVQDMQC